MQMQQRLSNSQRSSVRKAGPSCVPCPRPRATVASPVIAASAATQPHGRVFNFSAGPAILPVDVLEKAQADLLNWQGSGMSIMEMSHRGKEFESVIKKAEADLRKLLDIPSNYKVLFLQGGASTQFSMIPLNLAAEGDTVDYVVTGAWSKKAKEEADKYCKVRSTCATIECRGLHKVVTALQERLTTTRLVNQGPHIHMHAHGPCGGVQLRTLPEASLAVDAAAADGQLATALLRRGACMHACTRTCGQRTLPRPAPRT